MATERTQGQQRSNELDGSKASSGEQLEGMTEDGVEVSASLDDEDVAGDVVAEDHRGRSGSGSGSASRKTGRH
jgi:hypothetical protein